MLEALAALPPVLQALLATMFTWGVTALGASLVLFAAGVMIAASFWSLLAPSIELSAEGLLPMWVPPLIGFLAGGIFLRLLDCVLPHLDAAGGCGGHPHELAAQRPADIGDHAAQHPGGAGGRSGFRGRGLGDPRRFPGCGAGAGHRHRAPELPRGHRGCHALEA